MPNKILAAAEIAIACESVLEDEGYLIGGPPRTNADQSRAELPISHDGVRYLLSVKALS